MDNPQEFERLLSCLVEGNQAWAKTAPALALGVVRLRFAKNQQDNRAAVHDLGLATANLVMEATSRDLTLRQRKPLDEFVFTGKWGQPSPLLQKRDS